MPRAKRVDYNEDSSADEEMPRRTREKLKRRASSASSSCRSRTPAKTSRIKSAGNSKRETLNYEETRYDPEDRKVAKLTRSLSEITVLCNSDSKKREKENILRKTQKIIDSRVTDEFTRKTVSKCTQLSVMSGWERYLLGIDETDDDMAKWHNFQLKCVEQNKKPPDLWYFYTPPLQADKDKNLLYDRCFRLRDDNGNPDLMTFGDCFTTPIHNESKSLPIGVIMALYRKFGDKIGDCKIKMKYSWLYFIDDVPRDERQKKIWRDQLRSKNLPPEKAVFVSNNEMENELQRALRRVTVMSVRKFRRLLVENSPAASNPNDYFFLAGTFDNIANQLEVVDSSSGFLELRAKLDLVPEHKDKRRKKRLCKKL